MSGIPFLVTFSRNITMIIAEYVPSRTVQHLDDFLRKIVNTYARGGFVIYLDLVDMKFEKVRDKLAIVEVNTTVAREHVPEIERQIPLIKEHIRFKMSDFLCNPIAILVFIYVVYMCGIWLNAVPRKSGAVQGISPCNLVTGRTVNYNRDCRSFMGGYIEASTDTIVTNYSTPCTHRCITLGPAGNRQGSVKCFDLETCKVVVHRTISQIT